jgi:hypothetical protein
LIKEMQPLKKFSTVTCMDLMDIIINMSMSLRGV